jgi:diguanylate cyclase (GGDEF)-like protein
MSGHNDTLTDLPDRETLNSALAEALEHEESTALGVLDIDHFLEVNTEFGHTAGDRVLQVLAGILKEEAPGGAFRISGDEFAIVLPGLSLEQAFLRLEGLRAHVQAAAGQFELPDGRTITITIGVAQYPRDARSVRGLLQAADAALQAAKEGGRNQVALPPNEEMVMKSCYYPATSIRKLKALAERLRRKESHLLREALDDLFRKYDVPREN